ncbi:phage protein NinX family protein [Burkholderia cenocepacia]
MKVSELSGEALDYWVARAEGYDEQSARFVVDAHAYSSQWAHGGPIIERERISVVERGHHWFGDAPGVSETGGSPLEAAMRAYVATRFGDEVMG